jgi:nucleoside-diphosphate-sugar epimerase
MSIGLPILVTGAAGRVGGVGGAVVETLRQRDVPVRALVRRDDERADACISACACPRLTWRRPSRRGTGERRAEFTTMHLRAGFFRPQGSEFALT